MRRVFESRDGEEVHVGSDSGDLPGLWLVGDGGSSAEQAEAEGLEYASSPVSGTSGVGVDQRSTAVATTDESPQLHEGERLTALPCTFRSWVMVLQKSIQVISCDSKCEELVPSSRQYRLQSASRLWSSRLPESARLRPTSDRRS